MILSLLIISGCTSRDSSYSVNPHILDEICRLTYGDNYTTKFYTKYEGAYFIKAIECEYNISLKSDVKTKRWIELV